MAEIEKLAQALLKAQEEIKVALKDSENLYFHSRYASLRSVFDSCKPALSKNGIVVVQATQIKDSMMVLVTSLIHTSGQMMSSEYIIEPAKKDPQGYGSAVTYARRYSLASMIGIVTDDDDDDEARTEHKTYMTPKKKQVDNSTKDAPKEPDRPKKAESDILEATFVPASVMQSVQKSGGPLYVIKSEERDYFTENQSYAKMAKDAIKEHKAVLITSMSKDPSTILSLAV